LNALVAGRIDAFVYDRPLLAWLINQGFRNKAQLLDATFDSQYYAIALPSGSQLRVPLDLAILDALHSGWWAETQRRYLDHD
jgi:ABC-type amino acid transport substrate-binding protein